MCADGEPPLDKYSECRDFHFRKVSRRAQDAGRFDVPLIFTEFGACFDGERCAVEISNSADAFDDSLASWAYWMYKSFGDFTTTGGTSEGMFYDDGSVQELKKDAITRTYAHAIQGTPSKMFFSTLNDGFFVNFKYDASITSPTEIYADLKDRYELGW